MSSLWFLAPGGQLSSGTRDRATANRDALEDPEANQEYTSSGEGGDGGGRQEEEAALSEAILVEIGKALLLKLNLRKI